MSEPAELKDGPPRLAARREPGIIAQGLGLRTLVACPDSSSCRCRSYATGDYSRLMVLIAARCCRSVAVARARKGGQTVGRPIPRCSIFHPDVVGGGHAVGLVQAADRDVDLAGAAVVPIGERRAAACAERALHR